MDNTICNSIEQKIVNLIRLMPILSNIFYIIPSLFLIFMKNNNRMNFVDGKYLGVFGLIMSIISTIHHYSIKNETSCNKILPKYNIKMISIFSNIDVISANLLSLYGIIILHYKWYKWYKSEKNINNILILTYIIILFGLYTFFYSLYKEIHYENELIKVNYKYNNKYILENAIIYDIYHSFWHIFSSLIFLLVALTIFFTKK
jgi:hypothetical protein